MIEIICAVIAASATIICAYTAHSNEVRGKREDAMAERRAKEGRLQLAMISANNELSIGTAIAVRSGHANGEMEKGLAAVEKAQKEYRRFLEESALNEIRK